MPAINVNPTRQELTRLKTRLRTSIRGHKLLKDKRDELMKQFMDVVRENRPCGRGWRRLMRAHGSFTVASALMSTEMLEQALLYPKQSVELDMTFQNIMSVNVPVYHFKTKSDDAGEIYPYASPPPPANWTAPWRPCPACSRICSAWRRSKRPPSSWPRRSRRPPPGQRPGVCKDPPNGGGHPVYYHEAGRERARQHHPPHEGQGHVTERGHRGAQRGRC